MDDKEQAAIDALREAGLEDEARAVERVRARHVATLDAFHAAQRDSYKRGQDAERERCTKLCDLIAQDYAAANHSGGRDVASYCARAIAGDERGEDDGDITGKPGLLHETGWD